MSLSISNFEKFNLRLYFLEWKTMVSEAYLQKSTVRKKMIQYCLLRAKSVIPTNFVFQILYQLLFFQNFILILLEMSAKRKFINTTSVKKCNTIHKAENGINNKEAFQKFDISRSPILTGMKNKEKCFGVLG